MCLGVEQVRHHLPVADPNTPAHAQRDALFQDLSKVKAEHEAKMAEKKALSDQLDKLNKNVKSEVSRSLGIVTGTPGVKNVPPFCGLHSRSRRRKSRAQRATAQARRSTVRSREWQAEPPNVGGSVLPAHDFQPPSFSPPPPPLPLT